jgi:hypothetical protein
VDLRGPGWEDLKGPGRTFGSWVEGTVRTWEDLRVLGGRTFGSWVGGPKGLEWEDLRVLCGRTS